MDVAPHSPQPGAALAQQMCYTRDHTIVEIAAGLDVSRAALWDRGISDNLAAITWPPSDGLRP
jgi:hypothetical protein